MSTSSTVYDPDRHFPLREIPWDPALAEGFAQEIMDEVSSVWRPEKNWPAHPLDDEASAREGKPLATMYLGTEGVAWALSYWQRITDRKTDFASLPVLEAALAASEADDGSSYFFGLTGIHLAIYRIDPSERNRTRLIDQLHRLQKSETNEIMAGAPGALIAAQLFWELEGSDETKALVRELTLDTLSKWQTDSETSLPVWRQNYGRPMVYVGAAHGAVGNIFALLRAREHLNESELREVLEKTAAFVRGTALEDPQKRFANWPPVLGDTKLLLHWCHGSPGIAMLLAERFPKGFDEEVDRLLISAGELIWHAGGVKKGPSICHGTGGSGAALLKLFSRTQDERWLNRARVFAMNTIDQVRDHRATYGQLRYSLWTGDVGVALFLQSCLRGRFEIPMMDVI